MPAEESASAAPPANLQEEPSPRSTRSVDVKLPSLKEAHSLEGVPPQAEEENQTNPDLHPNPEASGIGQPAWLSWLTALRRRIGRQPPPTTYVTSSNPSEVQKTEATSQPEVGVTFNVRDFNPLPPESVEPASSSDQIFEEIGHRLRRRREMLSLTYEEIERHIRVRTAFLQALERGALDELPSPVQTRGILSNYAGFLDLDADAILLRFADGLQVRYREKGPRNPPRTRAPMTVNTSLPPLRSFIASDLLFGGGIAIMLLLFAIWGIGRVMAVRSVTSPQPTSPSISDILAGTALPVPSQQVTLIPAEDTSLAPASAVTATVQLETLDPNINVQIKLTATESTYVRVTVDGKVQFEGRAVIGTDYTYKAAKRIEILVGSGSAVRVTYNGHDLGLMGNFGEVVDRVYSEEGVATPTSTPQPTRTPTPNITTTPSETSTPTPSRTPTRKPGG